MTKQKQSYEQALTRLEEIIALLENEKTPLEDAMNYYAEGVTLLKESNEKLAAAEQKIQAVNLGTEPDNQSK